MDGTTQLLETDRQFLVHPLHHPEDHKAPLFIDHGRGAMLYDVDGRGVIDGLSGLWNVNIGHGRGELADAAATQMRKIGFASAYVGQTNEPAIRLSRDDRPPRLLATARPSISPPPAPNRTNRRSSSRATYWKVQDKPDKTKIISRWHAYHGVTMAAMSATGMAIYHKMFGPLVPGFIQVAPPYAYRWQGNEDPGIAAAEAVEKAILAEGPDTVAAVIAEPVMGAGGVIVPPADLFPQAARDLRQIRRADDRRRGDHRVRPHRALVRARPLGRRARPRLVRQGGDERLSAARRGHRLEADSRRDPVGAARPPLHACGDL
jgi:putrescine aminotransferase